MRCQFCDQPATIHFTKIIESQARHFHLCEGCSRQKQLYVAGQHSLPEIGLPAELSAMSFSAILQALLGRHLGDQAEKLARLTCPTCGLKYMEFRAAGRLGCPADYAAFRDGLLPILEQVHRAARHRGKWPRRRAASDAPVADELLGLRQELRRAVESEDFEAAARLRDLIRQKEAPDVAG